MRFVRMFTNAAVAGLLAAAYVTALVLELNPQVPLVSLTTVHWFVAVLSVHGLVLTVGVWIALVLRDALLLSPTRPAWLSVRVLAWVSAIFAGAAAWITWGNHSGFLAVLDADAAARLRTGAWAMTIAAGVLFVIAVLRFSFSGRRGGRFTGGPLTAALVASVVVPLLTRGVGEVVTPPVRPPLTVVPPSLQASAPAVRVIALDGASLGFIRARVAAGRLPNFGTILDRGAIMELATLRPTQPEAVWAAAATGKFPPKNGVRSANVYRPSPADDAVTVLPDYVFAQGLVDKGVVRAEPATATALRARPFWDILADFHLSSGVIRWPLTSPAHATRGFVISDRFDQTSASPLRLTDSTNGSPTTAAEAAREAFDETQFLPWPEVLPNDITVPASSATIAEARWDRSYNAALAKLREQFAVELTAIRYTGIDVLSHVYFGYSEPAQLMGAPGAGRNIAPEEQQRLGGALDRYYDWIDAQIRTTIDQLRPGDLLLVVSGFGMEPVGIAENLFDRVLREPPQSGTHENAPDGFLMAYGSNVAPAEYPRGAIVDLAPTILYYMGVPIGRDMDGYARTDIFQRAFTLGRPTTFIATHER